MKKRVFLAVLGVVVIIGVIAGVKALQITKMIEQGKKFVPPPETVTTAVAKAESWETFLTSVATLTAVQGVTVAAELPGKVVEIGFEPGTKAKRGDLLVRLDTSSEEAQLPGALAQAKAAAADLERAGKMVAEQIISTSEYDATVARHELALSQAQTIRATIGKKTIRAPFDGRLGIRQVNLGEILNEGTPVVTLQALDPVFVNFSVPQQQLPMLRPGLPVSITSDAFPGTTIDGRVTTVDPLIDEKTRNVRVQATVKNHGEKLRPGMFVNASMRLSGRQNVLSIPVTAVLYAPYGDSVFVVEDKDGKKTLRQQFVRLGSKKGDFVAVIEGLKDGETVVSTGVFKLQNGQTVLVDNTLAPPFTKSPTPENN